MKTHRSNCDYNAPGRSKKGQEKVQRPSVNETCWDCNAIIPAWHFLLYTTSSYALGQGHYPVHMYCKNAFSLSGELANGKLQYFLWILYKELSNFANVCANFSLKTGQELH